MRKVDVILLTALILYDYSAQSLVDRDIISMGKSFLTEHSSAMETKAVRPAIIVEANPATSETGIIADQPDEEVALLAPENQISYYELVNLVPAAVLNTENAAAENSVALHINTPSPFAEAAVSAPEQTVLEEEETKLSLNLVTVSAVMSTSFTSALENIEVKGELTAEGMQFADSDNDLMFDFEDKCPAVAGVARFEGCPVPDSDADGVNDEEDHCPFDAGDATANGCSLRDAINTSYTIAAKDNTAVEANSLLTVVQFEENSEILSTGDFNRVLKLADMVLNGSVSGVELMQQPDAHSVSQVNSVVQYLKDLGVQDAQIAVSNSNGNNTLVGGVEVKLRY